jgi:broad specificity phosphatase PhoE
VLKNRPLRIALIRHGESEANLDHRDWDSPHSPRNVLIVSHGLTMRLFCMRWFHWSVRFFESLSNPGNAETRVLLRQPDHRYKLDQPFEQWSPYTPSERERSAWSWCPEIR